MTTLSTFCIVSNMINHDLTSKTEHKLAATCNKLLATSKFRWVTENLSPAFEKSALSEVCYNPLDRWVITTYDLSFYAVSF